MDLIKLTYDCLEAVRPYFDKFESEASDINLTNLYMWRDKYHFHYIILGDHLFIANIKGENIYFSQPIGDYGSSESVYKSFEELQAFCQEKGLKCVVKKANRSFHDILDGRYSFTVSCSEDEQDYVYDFEELRQLAGKKFHKKKNHWNKFVKTYPDWIFRWYEDDDMEKVKSLIETWMEDKDNEDDDILLEREGIIDILAHRECFDLKIGILEVGGEICGFTIAEIIGGDMLLVHIEKADTNFEGVFTAIGHALYNACSNLLWINREQDLGIEGLRKSKMSYHPVRFVEKYEMRF